MQYACCMTRFLSGNDLKAQKFVVQVQVYHWWLNIWISIINNAAPALSVIWKRLYTITYWYYWYHCITDVTDTTDTTDIQMSLIYHIIHLIYWYISLLIFTDITDIFILLISYPTDTDISSLAGEPTSLEQSSVLKEDEGTP